MAGIFIDRPKPALAQGREVIQGCLLHKDCSEALKTDRPVTTLNGSHSDLAHFLVISYFRLGAAEGYSHVQYVSCNY
jgi:hypothetical protein